MTLPSNAPPRNELAELLFRQDALARARLTLSEVRALLEILDQQDARQLHNPHLSGPQRTIFGFDFFL